MTVMQWGKRQDGRIPLSDAGSHVTDFRLDSDTNAVAEIGNETWSFALGEETATATNGDVTWTADYPGGLKKAKRFVVHVGERSIDFINETKSDWIIDENDVKLGQFTGANHGVRAVAVDFEPDAPLDLHQRVYLAWLARKTLEQQVVASTWKLTLMLLILSVFILVVFFL